MRRLLLIAGAAVLALPSFAAAQPGCLPHAVNGQTATLGCDGYYDADGVWRQGGGHYDADGDWHSDSGYYDGDGQWVANAPTAPTPDQATPQAAGDFGVETAFVGASGDVAGREQGLDSRVRGYVASGAISPIDGAADLGRLSEIRGVAARFSARHGGLTDQDRADLNARLDDLGAAVTRQRAAD